MKLGSSVPGDHLYGVAVRDSGLWLTLWVRRSWKDEFFVFMPRTEGNNHASYHRDGTYHHKSDGRTFARKQLQRLDQPFKGTVHLGGFAGHSPKGVGAVCVPDAFTGVVKLPPGVLGPRDGVVLVDLVEPGCDPLTWPGELVRQKIFKDAEPWIVIRVLRNSLPGGAKSVKRCRRSHRKRNRQRLAAHARRLKR